MLASGFSRNVVYDFSKADVIVSLDSDFLFDEPGSLRRTLVLEDLTTHAQPCDGRRSQEGDRHDASQPVDPARTLHHPFLRL